MCIDVWLGAVGVTGSSQKLVAHMHKEKTVHKDVLWYVGLQTSWNYYTVLCLVLPCNFLFYNPIWINLVIDIQSLSLYTPVFSQIIFIKKQWSMAKIMHTVLQEIVSNMNGINFNIFQVHRSMLKHATILAFVSIKKRSPYTWYMGDLT